MVLKPPCNLATNLPFDSPLLPLTPSLAPLCPTLTSCCFLGLFLGHILCLKFFPLTWILHSSPLSLGPNVTFVVRPFLTALFKIAVSYALVPFSITSTIIWYTVGHLPCLALSPQNVNSMKTSLLVYILTVPQLLKTLSGPEFILQKYLLTQQINEIVEVI